MSEMPHYENAADKWLAEHPEIVESFIPASASSAVFAPVSPPVDEETHDRLCNLAASGIDPCTCPSPAPAAPSDAPGDTESRDRTHDLLAAIRRPLACREADDRHLCEEDVRRIAADVLTSDWLARDRATQRAEALREVAREWRHELRRDAALYDYGRWLDAAANMLDARADREAGR